MLIRHMHFPAPFIIFSDLIQSPRYIALRPHTLKAL